MMTKQSSPMSNKHHYHKVINKKLHLTCWILRKITLWPIRVIWRWMTKSKYSRTMKLLAWVSLWWKSIQIRMITPNFSRSMKQAKSLQRYHIQSLLTSRKNIRSIKELYARYTNYKTATLMQNYCFNSFSWERQCKNLDSNLKDKN